MYTLMLLLDDEGAQTVLRKKVTEVSLAGGNIQGIYIYTSECWHRAVGVNIMSDNMSRVYI